MSLHADAHALIIVQARPCSCKYVHAVLVSAAQGALVVRRFTELYTCLIAVISTPPANGQHGDVCWVSQFSMYKTLDVFALIAIAIQYINSFCLLNILDVK